MLIFQLYILVVVLMLIVSFYGAKGMHLSLRDHWYITSAALVWPVTLSLLALIYVGLIDIDL